jgi:hypothetical protein
MISHGDRIGRPDPMDPEFTADGTRDGLPVISDDPVPAPGGFNDGPLSHLHQPVAKNKEIALG